MFGKCILGLDLTRQLSMWLGILKVGERDLCS